MSRHRGINKDDIGSTGWLFERTEKLSADLQRNWLIMAVTGTLALTYAWNRPLVEGLEISLGGVKIQPNLLVSIIPVVLIYLYVQSGFLLGGYLSVRKEFDDPTHFAKVTASAQNDLFSGATYHNYSLYYAFYASLRERTVNMTLAAWIKLASYSLLIIMIAAVPAVNCAISVYFIGVLTWRFSLIAGLFFISSAVVLITAFYVHFFAHIRHEFPSGNWQLSLLPVVTAFIFGIALFWNDPLT
jgi:hypothetical protein